MGLVIWNDALSDGRGRSGARYALCFQPAGGGTRRGGRWRIDVDGAEICTVESAENAVRRAEGLEAIRCVIRGLGTELSEDQLQHAEVIVREMTEAADRAAADAPAGARGHSCCRACTRCARCRLRSGGNAPAARGRRIHPSSRCGIDAKAPAASGRAGAPYSQ
ncbi:MAG TPA: hypothetical protein VLV76_07890 [Candidatus Acidoferrum sp.]|nr:hypothetical protein [Candidatus Acidoferrum sp.]